MTIENFDFDKWAQTHGWIANKDGSWKKPQIRDAKFWYKTCLSDGLEVPHSHYAWALNSFCVAFFESMSKNNAHLD